MNNKLNIKIEQLKNINTIELNLPIETGLYAITGANGTGKSTIMTVISKVVRNSAFNVFNTSVKIYRTKKLNNGSRVTGSAI